ncbi:MAG: transposase [Oscillatoriales cyanobacterium RU_3_3]|nr:transposase [Oscillatoriales cyanobacterium RU_3_3]
MEKRQRFSPAFKREAVRQLRESGKPAAVVARELGIPRNRIYKWETDLEEQGAAAFSGSGRRPAAQDELSQLRRENARLQEENIILKKAAAYFARELK